MLVLFESPAGYAIFKLSDERKLQQTENLFLDFETPEKASKVVKLKHFDKFNDMTEALSAATAAVEGKMTKRLRKLLKKVVVKEARDQLAVADAKLGNIIKEKLKISCVSSSSVQELMRCIRSQVDSLIEGIPQKEMAAMALGLAHSLSRYKLKFSPDKVDTMIIQAVSLLDDLDKELNNYIMRCKEWYGWHFPELSKVVTDNTLYVKTVCQLGMRFCAENCDLSEILPEDVEKKVKATAAISMGTEISEDDLSNITHLCNEILEMQIYRGHLFEYLKSRMMAVAPNLSVLVGDLVGARLISHAGSLINLAKHPASTVQILGAEKALFRALKTKHDTPKYGLIYHAQLVGQASVNVKGKASRKLSCKTSLATRVDAFAEEHGHQLGAEHKAKLESQLKLLEEGGVRRISGSGKAKAKWEKYENKSQIFQYPTSQDSTLKRKFEEDSASPALKKFKSEDEEVTPGSSSKSEKKKKKPKMEADETIQIKEEPVEYEETPTKSEKKKKKLKVKTEMKIEALEHTEEVPDIDSSFQTEKKKKKKQKHQDSLQVKVEADDGLADASLDASEKKKKKKKRKSRESE